MNNIPVVISFYTLDSPYQLEVLNLIHSCNQFDIEHRIEGVKSRGTWAHNVAMKPAFIREKLCELKLPVFWVDADAAFLQQPKLDQFLMCDVAVRKMQETEQDRKLRYNAASLFINYNARTLTFMDEWVAECEKKIAEDENNLLYLDQTTLADLLPRRSDLSIRDIPIPYCKVYDLRSDLIDQKEVVIEQYQASRRFWHLM